MPQAKLIIYQNNENPFTNLEDKLGKTRTKILQLLIGILPDNMY